jgi:L-ascorbate metabolism protein UlaG (beta-lactamase superfamily)
MTFKPKKEEPMMKTCMVYLLVLLGIFVYANVALSANLTPEEMLDNIHWFGQAAVKIEAEGKIIYIDPFKIKKKTNDADIILITHCHQDHLSLADIAKVVKENTLFLAPHSCMKEMKKLKSVVMPSGPGMSKDIDGILIEAVPAYNVKKTKFHPKKNKWVGYVLTVNGVKIYHAGDTERIPEMKDFSCDIAMLPLGQTYTMNSVEEAADAALDVNAKIAIPIHYGMYEGKAEDAQRFAELLKDKVQVVIKEQE